MRETQRLDKVLVNLGYGSRTEIKKLSKQKQLKVNDLIVNDSSVHIDPLVDKIEVNNIPIVYREFVYIMLNKPAGYISATFDNRHKTVLDLLGDEYKCFNVFPVGRLDIDTEGLLLLTNDGNLSHELLSPSKHVPKTYFAIIDGKVTNDDIIAFSKGVDIGEGYTTLPAILKIIESDNQSKIEVTIFEGKFHQVKRMFESVGKNVVFLKRILMGSLVLDPSLKLGDFRELSTLELKNIKNAINC